MSPAMARRPEARWAQTSALRAVLRPSKKARATKRARAAARDAAADARGPPATGSGKAELIPNFSAARAIRDGNCHDTRGPETGQGAARAQCVSLDLGGTGIPDCASFGTGKNACATKMKTTGGPGPV